MRSYSFALILGLLEPLPICAQGTFRNLDFELSQIPQTQPPGPVTETLALPFWNVYYGSTQQTQVQWQQISVGSTEVSLIGRSGSTVASIDGGYSVFLYGSVPDVTISQLGVVPANALSLLLKAQFGGPGQQLFVSVGGIMLPIFDLSNGPNYTLYGVNIGQFASLPEELRFSAFSSGQEPSYWNIDDIVFSTTAVPEPSESALIAMGRLFCFSRKRRF